jgi:uncharacterized damage-inducible protein DinB
MWKPMFDTRAELLDVYRSTPVTLRALVRQVDDELARSQVVTGEWSIIEIVTHLADAEEMVVKRVERMLTEDNPELPAYDPAQLAGMSNYRSRDIAEELDRFDAVRAALTSRLEGLDDSGWARTGQHEEVGEITVEDMTAHMAAHDSIHLAQIAHILLAL